MAFTTIGRIPVSCRCPSTPRVAVPARPAQQRKRARWTAAVAEGKNASSISDLKQAIVEQAGERSGLDRCEPIYLQNECVVHHMPLQSAAYISKAVLYTILSFFCVCSFLVVYNCLESLRDSSLDSHHWQGPW